MTVYGTEPAPIELTARYSLWGPENVSRLISQLRKAGVDTSTIVKFDHEVTRLRDELGESGGQMEPITQAAELIGAKVRWIN